MGIHDELPVSVQVISGRFHESICLDIAEDIERYVRQVTPVMAARVLRQM